MRGQGDMALVNLSLKFYYSLVNPVAGEQGLGCHGRAQGQERQAARSSNSQRASPSPCRRLMGARAQSLGLLAGPSSTHTKAYQAQGSAPTTSPGRPRLIAGIAIDGGQRGWREKIRTAQGEQLCAFPWQDRAGTDPTCQHDTRIPHPGTGSRRHDGRSAGSEPRAQPPTRAPSAHTKAPSATTNERHGEHKVATVGRTPRSSAPTRSRWTRFRVLLALWLLVP